MPALLPNQDEHVVRQQPSDDPCARHFASLFALANGVIGIRGSIDELAEAPDLILPQAYLTSPVHYHEAFPGYADATETRVLCPSPLLVRILIDGIRVELADAEMVRFDRYLDIDAGLLHRETLWRLADGREFSIEATRLVPLDGGAIVASRLRLTALNFAGEVVLQPGYGLGGNEAEVDRDDPRISARIATGWRLEPGACPGTDRLVSRDLAISCHSSLVATTGELRSDEAGEAVVLRLRPGEAIAYERIVEFARENASDSALIGNTAAGFDQWKRRQRETLTSFWRGADCAIDDDPRLTQALRFNRFQVLQSASRCGAHGTAAKGLTGDGYEGHCFWDTEAFVLPALILAAPERARAVIAYRVATLDAARHNARLLGHARGALYAWRTISGRECSTHYPTGSAQYHINADIACALKLYIDVTGNHACLDSAGEMLFETARVWLDIGGFDPARGGVFCIYGVTGPDEYTALIDNDFYTNAAARRHLEFAVEVAERLALRDAARFAELSARIGLDSAEIEQWRRAAAALALPVDGVLGIDAQDDTFLGKPRFPAPLRVPGRPLLLDHHPMTLFRHQVCKQGNVVQALAAGLVDPPLERVARDYAYYEPITSHDSTLSAPAFGIVAARIGADADARRFLEEAAWVDLENRHHNTDHGLHMAAMAGSWLVLAQGWAGLRMAEDGLYFSPRSAPELARYTLNVAWRGRSLAVRVDPRGATYRVIEGAPLLLRDHGRAVVVGPEPVFVARPRIRAVIFDLDGVLTDTAEDHCAAWAELARRHGLAFDRAFNERLKGVDRAASLRLILAHSGVTMADDRFAACLAEKNAIYLERLATYTPANLFPGVRALFAACRGAGLKVALASASRNAPEVLARLGIADEFDFVADAASVAAPKPAPDIFLACAAAMGVAPGDCVGIEDAQAGVDAILAAGMTAIGIGPAGSLAGVDQAADHVSQLGMAIILGSGNSQDVSKSGHSSTV